MGLLMRSPAHGEFGTAPFPAQLQPGLSQEDFVIFGHIIVTNLRHLK